MNIELYSFLRQIQKQLIEDSKSNIKDTFICSQEYLGNDACGFCSEIFLSHINKKSAMKYLYSHLLKLQTKAAQNKPIWNKKSQ